MQIVFFMAALAAIVYFIITIETRVERDMCSTRERALRPIRSSRRIKTGVVYTILENVPVDRERVRDVTMRYAGDIATYRMEQFGFPDAIPPVRNPEALMPGMRVRFSGGERASADYRPRYGKLARHAVYWEVECGAD